MPHEVENGRVDLLNHDDQTPGDMLAAALAAEAARRGQLAPGQWTCGNCHQVCFTQPCAGCGAFVGPAA